jgi:hypothetical protein
MAGAGSLLAVISKPADTAVLHVIAGTNAAKKQLEIRRYNDRPLYYIAGAVLVITETPKASIITCNLHQRQFYLHAMCPSSGWPLSP